MQEALVFRKRKPSRKYCLEIAKVLKRGSYMVWEINMGVCPRLEFDNIMFINSLGYDLYIFLVYLSYYAITLLIYDVMYDITKIP